MQIHEITAKPVKEGVLGGVAAPFLKAASAVGNMAKAAPDFFANKILDKAGVPAGQLYRGKPVWDQSNTKLGYGAAMGQQRQQAQPILAKQAQAEMNRWNRALKALMTQQKVDEPKDLDQGSKQDMIRSLSNELHNKFLQNKVGNNYTALPNMVDAQAQTKANELVKNIAAAVRGIRSSLNGPVPDATTQLKQWTNLLTTAYDAVLLAQNRPTRKVADTTQGGVVDKIHQAIEKLVNQSSTLKQQMASKAPDQITPEEKQEVQRIKVEADKLANILISQGLVGMLPGDDWKQLELLKQVEDEESEEEKRLNDYYKSLGLTR
jgi:hypothetical protein